VPVGGKITGSIMSTGRIKVYAVTVSELRDEFREKNDQGPYADDTVRQGKKNPDLARGEISRA